MNDFGDAIEELRRYVDEGADVEDAMVEYLLLRNYTIQFPFQNDLAKMIAEGCGGA